MIIRGDARWIPLRDGCVQTVVTSPPYWGLRDYGTARWEGGDAECDHDSARIRSRADYPFSDASRKQTTSQGALLKTYGPECACGATKIDQQIGLEPTPQDYLDTMLIVFHEIWRVLRDDGVVWLNLGDSYAGSLKGANGDGTWQDRSNCKQGTNNGSLNLPPTKAKSIGLKNKDLIGIPWMLALALRGAGWYLRSDIIWAKPNPMPESVTDRPTRSHEYIFLLAKSERYFYDQSAILEPLVGELHSPGNRKITHMSDDRVDAVWGNANGRNKRSVWTVNSEPTPEAHFATFPQKLIEPCILAGSRSGDLVFDPFIGSGTTGKVAERLGRQWVGLELSADYIKIASNRTAQLGLGL